MGNTASSPVTDETRVYTPTTPIQFSPSLLQKLESSVDSNYSRLQTKEKETQRHVYNELRKVQAEGIEMYNKAFDSISGPDADDKREGSDELREKLTKLKDVLGSRKEKGNYDKQTLKARDAVVSCLKDNEGQPLKCQDEVDAFKARIRHLEQNQ